MRLKQAVPVSRSKTLFRSLLFGIWYRLSDVQLAQSLYRDLLFRKFCCLELGGQVPEASTLGRFRTQLVEHDFWERLLGEINRLLEAKSIIMTEGVSILSMRRQLKRRNRDQAKIKEGQPKRDPEAGWHVKKNSRGLKKSTYVFSVHTGVDEDGFIHRQSVTSGEVHDTQERDRLLLGDEKALYADAAYSSKESRNKLKQWGIDDQVQRKGYRGHPLSAVDKVRNDEIVVTRAGGERPITTYKRHYALARTRFMGLAKNTTFYGLAAMAANIRKGASFLARYGLPDFANDRISAS